MRFFLSLLIFVCSFSVSVADEATELVVKREIVKRKLEKMNYYKWIHVQQEYLSQATLVQNIKLKSVTLRQKELLMIQNYNDLRDFKESQLKASTSEQNESIEKKALELTTKNLAYEKQFKSLAKEKAGIEELVVKHAVLLEKLEYAELTLRKTIEPHAEKIDSLLAELKIITNKLEKVDLKKKREAQNGQQ